MNDDLSMLLGPARDGSLLEVGVLDLDGDDPVAIHAMPYAPGSIRCLDKEVTNDPTH